MGAGRAEHEPGDPGGATPPASRAGRMRAAISRVAALGPVFLRGDVGADRMANTMVDAVSDYFERERALGGEAAPSAEAEKLNAVLAELMGCGSGYLAGRCDAACVARTMTEIVREFPSASRP